MTNEQKLEADSLKWWHRIPLEFDDKGNSTYTTNGLCPHGHPGDFETRFGLPKDLRGKSVLDVGGYDGLFSFECEKRGARTVRMIDIYQQPLNTKSPNRPFQLAKEVLRSKVDYEFSDLEGFENAGSVYGLILYYGVLYHIQDPLGAVKLLMNLVSEGGEILMETAIAVPSLYSLPQPILEYRPGFDNDPTNQWYPNREWVKRAFMENGAKDVEIVYEETHRATYRIKA